ncbi:MAG TPA: preprotein translocase subunit YajC [Gaiellaceae bacterium]|nr:preprotein translocase subunit YajC [Gaiellaceae bacterium]
MSVLIIIVVAFVLLWALLIRPQRRRSQVQIDMQDTLRKGDEIITAGGLHGTVVSIEDDVLEIEIAKNTVARLDRRAVAAVVSPQEPEEEPAEETHSEEPVSADDG